MFVRALSLMCNISIIILCLKVSKRWRKQRTRSLSRDFWTSLKVQLNFVWSFTVQKNWTFFKHNHTFDRIFKIPESDGIHGHINELDDFLYKHFDLINQLRVSFLFWVFFVWAWERKFWHKERLCVDISDSGKKLWIRNGS